MTRLPLFAACAFVLAVAQPVAAQSLKPGLWEVRNTMQGAAGGQMDQAMVQMREQMAAMPPDQRKMVEEMMAAKGMRMGQGGGGGMAVQICMTREMVERNDVPMERNDCRMTQQQRTGNTMKVAFACTNPPSTGEGQVTFNGPESYSSRMTVKTTVQGRAETLTVDGIGKWLAADCGNVKPPAR